MASLSLALRLFLAALAFALPVTIAYLATREPSSAPSAAVGDRASPERDDREPGLTAP